MGNLLNASISQTPLVVTAGQQDSRHAITDPLLLGDLVSLAAPAVKWAQEVTRADQLPVLVRRAFNDCVAAPAGPVLLSFPMNVMEEMTSEPLTRGSVIDRRAVAGSLDVLARHLAGIKPGRLAIIAGDEVHAAGAAADVVKLAETLAAPVFGSSWPSRIPFPTAHALWAGNLSTRATEIARILSDYDAIFALGGKSLITILYSEGSAVPASCQVFQMSADSRDLGRTYSSTLSVVGDIGASLKALTPLVQAEAAGQSAVYEGLLQEATDRRCRRRSDLNRLAEAQAKNPVISPLVAAHHIVRAIGPETPIVDEAIATSAHVRRFLNSNSPVQYSFLRGGALGWAMPAAVGCSLGLGRRPVVCLVGDGAALYSPQALWTAAHEKLPVTFVVMNNREYNVLKNFMRTQSDYLSTQSDHFIAMDLVDPAIDYQALAKSMGVRSCRIEGAADIIPAIQSAIVSGSPSLVEIMISTE
jgi:benzoylformate decarboxylase